MVKVFGWRLGLPGGGALPLVQHIRTSNVCTANAYFFRKLGGRFSLAPLQWKKCRPRKAVISSLLKPYLFAHPNPISAIISWIISWTIGWQIVPYKTERWL